MLIFHLSTAVIASSFTAALSEFELQKNRKIFELKDLINKYSVKTYRKTIRPYDVLYSIEKAENIETN